VADVRPFRAVHYDERKTGPASDLVAPPYDVISAEEREQYLARSPYNVARLILPDSPDDAARLWRDWRAEGVLVGEAEPALWWLREDYEGPDGNRHRREGFFGLVRVEPYERGIVRPHERTHEAARRSQLELLRAVRANLSPILLLYDDPEQRPRKALAPLAEGDPFFEAADGSSTARIWRITDPGAIAEAQSALADSSLVIADGHHRYETSVAFAAEDGSPQAQVMMAVFANTDGEGLVIFPTHRVVRELPDLNGNFRITPLGSSPEEALARLGEVDHEHAAFLVYRRDGAALVESPGDDRLDTVVLEQLGIDEPQYTARADEAVALVDNGEAEAAFLLRPPTIQQVRAVAEAGRTMPQKSTYFYPKLFSGLLFHEL
jgi:uncharacterized protein (DUF1015 family)